MNRYVLKYVSLVLIIICFAALPGCWDYNELENRGYVMGMAVDMADKVKKERKSQGLNERDFERFETWEGEPKYAYTLHLPRFSKSKGDEPAQEGGGERKAWNLTLYGNSFFEANRVFSTRVNTPPFYEHTQVYVISEDVARQGITESLDFLLRDPETRRRIKVFVTPQKAYEIFEVSPKFAEASAMYLARLPENAEKTARIIHKVDLGELAENLHTKSDFILPRVEATKDEIRNAGGAVIKEDKMVGWLGEIDSMSVEWIKGVIKGGTIVTRMPEGYEGLITLEVRKAKSKVNPVVSGNKVKMDIDIKADVSIAEEFVKEFHDTFTEEFIEEVEAKAEEKLKNQLEDTVKYVQEEFGADIFLFDEAMEIKKPNEWERMKDNWHDIFPSIETNISISIENKQRGLVR